VTNYQTQELVYGSAFMDTVIEALVTRPAGALVVTGKVRLSKDPAFDPAPGSVITDFTTHEADYSGYAAGGIAVALSAPLNVTTTIRGALTSALFVAATASPFVPNNVYGYWLDDGTNVIAGERFAGGGVASFGAPGDFLDLEAMLPFGLLQGVA